MSQHSVFMIGWEYPPHNSGGLGVACQGMTQALAGQGRRLFFTLPFDFQDQVPHMQVLGCYNPKWFDDDGHQSTMGPPVATYTTAAPKLTPKQLKKIVSTEALQALPQSELEQRVTEYASHVAATGGRHQHHYDLIHAHDWMSFPAAAKLKSQTKKPVVAHVHSTEFDRIPHGDGSPYIKHVESNGLAIADRIIAVSEYTKRLIVNNYGIDAAKIDVVYNGIDPLPTPPDTTPTFAHQRPVVAFMGRLTMQKGAEYFVELARRVLSELPDALFIIAGSGDQYHNLMFHAASRQLSAHLLFAGFVRGSDRDNFLNRADVFVMPSLSEPFGLVALEAAQRHTPVIVSTNSGVSEVLSTAVKADFWDVDQMGQQICQLITDDQYRHRVVSGQLQDMEHLTWDRAAQRIHQSYMHVFT